MQTQNDFFRSGPHTMEHGAGFLPDENPWDVYHRELAEWERIEEIAFLESRVGIESWEGTGIAPPSRPSCG